MKRVPIRNHRSPKDVKPRVFDALIEDDGDVKLEVKQGKVSETIPLADVLKQISTAKQMATEP